MLLIMKDSVVSVDYELKVDDGNGNLITADNPSRDNLWFTYMVQVSYWLNLRKICWEKQQVIQ